MERGKKFTRSKPPCPLSDPANPHKLGRQSDPPLSICFSCEGLQLERKRYYYYCATCDLDFHRGCHFFVPEIRHPFHLLHPLTLTSSENLDFDLSDIPNDWASASSDSGDYDSNLYVSRRQDPIHWDPDSSDSDSSDSDSSDLEDSEADRSKDDSDENHQKCKSCRRNLVDEDPYYHCSICNFSLHLECTFNRPPLTIKNLKTHDHTLTLFPRRVPLPCDACGFSLDAVLDQVYSCLLCNYMVHRSCIYLPRVIKITRHPHRLSHTSSLVPSGELFSCGVCRKAVDVNYGNYSCNKGCHYAVHSKCATQDKVWDGKDLEGVPEEEEEVIEPFVRIDEVTIQHFTHDHHHLKIHGNDNRGDHEHKFCQACILPITVLDRFYSCIHCDFVLHETCASLPRIKHHPIHKHPLTLFHPFSSNPRELVLDYYTKGFFSCNGCSRRGCGFMYKCTEKKCAFELDVRCASLPDPLTDDCHPHDLFFNLTKGECMGCKAEFSNHYLECIECNSFLCLECATLPSPAHYKHDKHPLTLCYGEDETTDLQYWCEICEGKLDATKWFYTCNSCRVTLHVTCLLGNEVYMMKPNHIIKNVLDDKVEIARNSGHTRPVCDNCGCRCVDTLVFKWFDRTLCNMYCLWISVIEETLISSD